MLQRLQKIVRHPLFGFTASYLVIVAILLGTCAFSLTQVFRVHEKSSLDANEALLQQSVESIESSFDTASLFSEILMTNTSLRSLMSRQAEVYELSPVQQDMALFNDANNLVIDYFVYMARSDIILNSLRGYINLAQYYDYFFQYGTLRYEEWRNSILHWTANRQLFAAGDIMVNGTLRCALLQVVPYIDLQTGSPLGVIVYTIDADRIRQLLLRGNWNEQSLCFVLDNGGNLLMLTQPECAQQIAPLAGNSGHSVMRLNGQRYQVVTCSSPQLGLTFGVARPYSLLWASTFESMRSIIAGMGLIFIFATLIVLQAYFSNHRPLKSIVNRLHPTSPDRTVAANGLWQISGSIENLNNANEQLRLSIAEQQTQLRNVLFSRLMQGDAAQEDFIEELLTHVNIPLKGLCYRGVYVCLDAEQSDVRPTALSEAQLIGELHQQPHLLFMSMNAANRFACLFAASMDVSVEETLSSLHKTLSGRYNLECLFAVGCPVFQLRDLHYSFEAAAALLEKRTLGQFLMVRDDKPVSSTQYSYSQAEEQAFRRFVNANSMEEVDALLQQIYQRNFVQRSLDSLQRTRLYCRMLDSLYSANSEVAISDPLYFHLSELKPEEFFEELRRQYSQLCSATASNKLREQNELSQHILRFIQDNMGNADMGLCMVAEHFKMNEKYMSLFIREHAGITFSAYLENIRIEAAQKLLLETELPINDIAAQTGYLNANTFRRAFHRVTRLSPSQYRDMKTQSTPES